MILKIYSIFDEKINAFMTPFFAPADGAAVRSFKDLCMDDSSTVSKNLEDFSLYRIGEYNDSDASVIATVPVELIVRAVEFRYKHEVI